jgi:hypothetical protein
MEKQRVTFEQVLGHYGIPMGRVVKDEVAVLCPMHDDRSPSCKVNLKKNQFYCFPCGQGGGVIKFVMEKEKCDKDRAIQLLREWTGVKITYRVKEQKDRPLHPRVQRLIGDWQTMMRIHMALPVTQEAEDSLQATFIGGNGSTKDIDSQVIVGFTAFVNQELGKNDQFYEEGWYAQNTELGKLETACKSLERGCSGLIYQIEQATKKGIPKEFKRRMYELHLAKDAEAFFKEANEDWWNYVEMKNMLEVLKDEFLKYGTLFFRYARSRDGEMLEKTRKRCIDFYITLEKMQRQGSYWMESFHKIDWLGVV